MNILITLFWIFLSIWCGCFIGWIIAFLIRASKDLRLSFIFAQLVCVIILNIILLISKIGVI